MPAIWVAVALQVALPSLSNPPIIRATMNHQSIYTSGVSIGRDPDPKWASGGGTLWIQMMDLDQGSPITSLAYMRGLDGGRRDALLRWQIIKDQYYCVNYSGGGGIAASAFRSGYVQTVPLAAIESVNANRRAGNFFPGFYQKYVNSFESDLYLGPVKKAVVWGEDSLQNRRVLFDFWCRGGKQFEVYVSEPHKGNRLTRGDFHPEWQHKLDYEKWETVGEWTFDWTGPFYVTATGDDRYFVTDTGQVFAAPRGAKAGTPLKAIWKGKPVGALIHDADAKKWYAFTPDEYFEVADPIKPRPHAVPIRRESLANAALETAAKCGRVIRGLPEPKNDK
jgi:hypothetical protein